MYYPALPGVQMVGSPHHDADKPDGQVNVHAEVQSIIRQLPTTTKGLVEGGHRASARLVFRQNGMQDGLLQS